MRTTTLLSTTLLSLLFLTGISAAQPGPAEFEWNEYALPTYWEFGSAGLGLWIALTENDLLCFLAESGIGGITCPGWDNASALSKKVIPNASFESFNVSFSHPVYVAVTPLGAVSLDDILAFGEAQFSESRHRSVKKEKIYLSISYRVVGLIEDLQGACPGGFVDLNMVWKRFVDHSTGTWSVMLHGPRLECPDSVQ